MTDDPRSLRSLQARIAALTRAAQTDGSEISAPGRAAFMKSFETGHECQHCTPIVIDQSLPPEQQARAVQAAISAHFSRLALASARSRGKAQALIRQSRAADRAIAEGLAQLDAAAE
jgi:hypothetical protein